MDQIKKYRHLIFLVIAIFATLGLYAWFSKTPTFAHIIDWAADNTGWYFVILFLLKVFGIVWPPLPGGVLTLGSIPVIGWELAYLADFAGSTVGATIAFFLGRKYGYQFLGKLFDKETIAKFKKIKIKKGRELESIFVLRFLGGTVVEVVNYGLGLFKVKYSNFLVATTLSHLAFGIPTYYVAKNIFSAQNILASVVLGVFVLIFIEKIKGRYFE